MQNLEHAEESLIVSEEQKQSQDVPKKARPAKTVSEQARPAEKSYWPMVLALAVVILLLGIIFSPIVLGIGVVLTAAAIIGWGLEKR